MYTLKQISDNQYHLIDKANQPLKGWDGQPLVMNKEVAELALFNINNPVYRFPEPARKSEVKGVVDNRSHNWRRRR